MAELLERDRHLVVVGGVHEHGTLTVLVEVLHVQFLDVGFFDLVAGVERLLEGAARAQARQRP